MQLFEIQPHGLNTQLHGRRTAHISTSSRTDASTKECSYFKYSLTVLTHSFMAAAKHQLTHRRQH
jgi:hypothetical protein